MRRVPYVYFVQNKLFYLIYEECKVSLSLSSIFLIISFECMRFKNVVIIYKYWESYGNKKFRIYLQKVFFCFLSIWP